MKLRLAEAPTYASLAEGIADNYINVPDPDSGEIIKIRADFFDDLSPEMWEATMAALEPFNTGMNGIFSGFKERQQAKKTARQAKKAAKRADRQENVKTRWGAIKDIASSIGGGGSNQVSVDPFGGASGMYPEKAGFTGGIDFGGGEPVKEWYENPWILGGGAAAILGGIYLLTKKK